jgi:hypothetical protein
LKAQSPIALLYALSRRRRTQHIRVSMANILRPVGIFLAGRANVPSLRPHFRLLLHRTATHPSSSSSFRLSPSLRVHFSSGRRWRSLPR